MKRVCLQSQKKTFRYDHARIEQARRERLKLDSGKFSLRRREAHPVSFRYPESNPEAVLAEGFRYLAWRRKSALAHARKMGGTADELEGWIERRGVVKAGKFLLVPVGGQSLDPFMRKMIGVNIIEEVKDLLKPEQRDPVDA